LRVIVKLFAFLREACGRDELVLDLPDGATAADLLERLSRLEALRDLISPDRVRVAINRRYASLDSRIREGDEVAVLPPVSGGGIVEELPDLEEVVSRLSRGGEVGAVALFLGIVRSEGGRVARLEYEVYGDMAEEQLREIEKEAIERFGVRSVEVYHRFGPIEPGGRVMLIAVAAEHRREAFEALSWVVDQVKSRAPIWKKEVLSEGGERWVE